MLRERIEAKWIDAFVGLFDLCGLEPGDAVAILSESQSRPVNVELAELALHRIGAKPFHVVVPSPPQTAPVPVRSTGASDAVQGAEPVIAALAASTMVVDLTVEGMLHAPELPRILGNGARLMMIEGMGHDLPRGVWSRIIDAISEHARAADTARASAAA